MYAIVLLYKCIYTYCLTEHTLDGLEGFVANGDCFSQHYCGNDLSVLSNTLFVGCLSRGQIRLVLSLFGVELREMVDLAFVVFLMLHAAVNPILYGVVRRTVRRTYWWGLRRAMGAILCSKRCRPRESLSESTCYTLLAAWQFSTLATSVQGYSIVCI